MDERKLILDIYELNVAYSYRLMTCGLPGSITLLYRDISNVALECAREWYLDKPCPPHDPTVDAFVQAAWEWARNLGISILPLEEWANWRYSYVSPGIMFSNYVTPRCIDPDMHGVSGSAPEIFMELDKVFTRRVIRLTLKRGFVSSLRHLPKLPGVFSLLRSLRPDTEEGMLVLQADIAFTESTLKLVDWGEKSNIPRLAGEFLTKAKEAAHHDHA